MNVIRSQHRQEPLSGAAAQMADDFLNRINGLLGIVRHESPREPQSSKDDEFAEKVELLLEQRTAARSSKDWARADEIRAEIDALGVEVMDNPTGSTWRRKL